MAIETAKLVVTADVTQFSRGASEAGLAASALAEKVKTVGASTKETEKELNRLGSSFQGLRDETEGVSTALGDARTETKSFVSSFVEGMGAAANAANRVVGTIKAIRGAIKDVREIADKGFLSWMGLPEAQDFLFHRREAPGGGSDPVSFARVRGAALREQTRFDAALLTSVLAATTGVEARRRDLRGLAGIRSTVQDVSGAVPGLLGQLGVVDDRVAWEWAKLQGSGGNARRARRARRAGSAADTSWTWGNVFRQSPTQEAIGGGFRSLWGAVRDAGATNFSGGVADAAAGVTGGIVDALHAFGSGAASVLAPGVKGAEDMRKFEGQLNDTSSVLGGSFAAMTSGLSAAVDAAVTGSMAIGKAFKQAAAAALKSLAIESAVRAAYNTAMGLGALVFRPDAAAGYFAAAAQFSATAVLAGAGGALLGGGGGGGGGGAAASGPRAVPYVGGGGGGGGGGPQTIVVNIGGGVVASPTELGRVIDEAVNQGRRAGRVRDEKNVVVRYE